MQVMLVGILGIRSGKSALEIISLTLFCRVTLQCTLMIVAVAAHVSLLCTLHILSNIAVHYDYNE